MEITLQPLDEEKLFFTETYTDGRAGFLQVKTPCNFEGHRVFSRPEEFAGTTMIQTNVGPIQVSFSIEASSLREAFSKWPEAAKTAVEKQIAEMQSAAFRRAIEIPKVKKS